LALAKGNAGNFIGFAMPAVDFQKTELLESMLQPKQAEQKNLRSDQGARVVVAANLALAVSAIHEQGHQIVDLKPPNLRLYRKELFVAVLDCDGFHISVPGRTLSAPQATPEYLAPEYHSKPITEPEQQDRFALAVILFRMLNFGIHPYDGRAKNNIAPTDREGRVAGGMYAYGITPLSTVAPLPVSAHRFFPEELRRHFDRAFGSIAARRPSAREWSAALIKYAEKKNMLLKACSLGHLWFTGQPCGVCHRDGVLNRVNVSVPLQAFDIERVWREIESVVSPSVVEETETDAHTPSPAPLSEDVARAKKLVFIQKILAVVLASIAFFFMGTPFIFMIVIAFLWYRYPIGKGSIRRERELRALKRQEAQKKYDALKGDWDRKGSENLFDQQFKMLRVLKSEYEKLEDRFQKKLKEVVDELRDARLSEYLKNALIEPGTIEGIGSGLIEKLELYGICSAADINQQAISSIPGFGQAREERLIDWQNEVINSFSFDPADALTPATLLSIKKPFTKQIESMEASLVRGLENLKICKIKILKYRQVSLRSMCDAAENLKQMEVDLAVIDK
jgi:DNA-binding helix-hairpin-helix protein with protein kinase domain